jgi:hypothetical protein
MTLGILGNKSGTTGTKEQLQKTLRDIHTIYSKDFESYLDYIKKKIDHYKKPIRIELGIPDNPHLPCQLPPIPLILTIIDPEQIFCSFINLDLWDEFKKNGTIIIPDIMKEYDTPQINRMIELEFKMYQYHCAQTKGTHG